MKVFTVTRKDGTGRLFLCEKLIVRIERVNSKEIRSTETVASVSAVYSSGPKRFQRDPPVRQVTECKQLQTCSKKIVRENLNKVSVITECALCFHIYFMLKIRFL